jgi:hypothetical protein
MPARRPARNAANATRRAYIVWNRELETQHPAPAPRDAPAIHRVDI